MMSETGVRQERGARPVCLRCESLEVLPTLYGMPTYDAWLSGKYAVMGCEISWGDVPEWECQNCHLVF